MGNAVSWIAFDRERDIATTIMMSSSLIHWLSTAVAILRRNIARCNLLNDALISLWRRTHQFMKGYSDGVIRPAPQLEIFRPRKNHESLWIEIRTKEKVTVDLLFSGHAVCELLRFNLRFKIIHKLDNYAGKATSTTISLNFVYIVESWVPSSMCFVRGVKQWLFKS